jgi:spore coat polysaccharide biosynthesis predicted glycosyltransferase SpsG
MKILFRLDASQKVGLGHLIRTLLIAKTIKQKYNKTEITFLINNYQHTILKVKNSGFNYIITDDQSEEEFLIQNCLNRGVDTLFIDKLYNYSEAFIQKLTAYTRVVMFHNLCDGGHLSDAFILPASHVDPQIIKDYKLTSGHAKFYEGMDFVVLNEKIINLEKSKSNKSKMNLVITTGGSDPSGVMLKVLNWISNVDSSKLNVYALIGETFIHHEKLELLKKKLNSNIVIAPYDVSYFKEADIAISTFGVSTYEMIYLGLVILSIAHCKQNAKGSRILSEKCDQLIDFGNIEDLGFERFNIGLENAVDSLGTKSVNFCSLDSYGADRVAEIIYNQGKRR